MPYLNIASANMRAEAYSRLGVTPQDVVRQPQITPQLRAIAVTLRRGGQPRKTRRILSQSGGSATLVEDTEHAVPYGPGADLYMSWSIYLQAVDDPDAHKVLDAFYSIPSVYRKLLPIEAFCLVAAVSPIRILEVLTLALMRLGAQASSIVAAVNQPRVVEKMVEMALTDDGIADRTLLSRATGFLPSPAAAKTQINIQQNASANASAPVAVVAAPPAEQTVRRLVERFHEARGLPASTASMPILTEGSDSMAIPAMPLTESLREDAVISRRRESAQVELESAADDEANV